MTYIPPTLPASDMARVDRWLVRNGCRHHVALDPVIIKGNYVEYTALCRRDHKSTKRAPMNAERDEILPLGRKRLRIRYPLHEAKYA